MEDILPLFMIQSGLSPLVQQETDHMGAAETEARDKHNTGIFSSKVFSAL